MNTEKHEVFYQDTFFRQLYSDLDSARSVVLLQSPFISVRQLKNIAPSLKRCRARGVRVCVFVQQPVGWASNPNLPTNAMFKDGLQLLRSVGVHTTIRPKIHEKLVVIDDDIFWDGSLNALSHYDTSERMTRWISRDKVRSSITKHDLISCAECLSSWVHHLYAPNQTLETWQFVIGASIAGVRKAHGLSQSDLARQTSVNRSIIVEIEHGKRNVELKTLIRICDPLEMSPLLVPRYYVPAIGEFFRTQVF